MPRQCSKHQSETEWAEARQMLNDAGLSETTVPDAVAGFIAARNRSMLDQARTRSLERANSV